MQKLQLCSEYLGDIVTTQDILLKTTDGLLQTEDVLLKTQGVLLQTEDVLLTIKDSLLTTIVNQMIFCIWGVLSFPKHIFQNGSCFRDYEPSEVYISSSFLYKCDTF